MSMIAFGSDDHLGKGYLALPQARAGKGVLVLHPWWGLNEFIKGLCDRLADEGFVAFAPDLHQGKIARTIEEATQLMKTRDQASAQIIAEQALQWLQNNPAANDSKLSAVGMSMGAEYALTLDSLEPEAFDKVVLFYGGAGADLSSSRAQFQLHFAEDDDWEPVGNARQMHTANAQIFIYPHIYHWFFETDRTAHYNPQAAELAWQRMLAFLRAE